SGRLARLVGRGRGGLVDLGVRGPPDTDDVGGQGAVVDPYAAAGGRVTSGARLGGVATHRGDRARSLHGGDDDVHVVRRVGGPATGGVAEPEEHDVARLRVVPGHFGSVGPHPVVEADRPRVAGRPGVFASDDLD